MEIKVLAAVFLTLFGVAVAMGQGKLSAEDLTDAGELMSRFQDNLATVSESGGDLLGSIRGDSNEPANTSMQASFTANESITSIRIREKTERVMVNGSSMNISVAGLEASPSRADVVLRNYTGRIRFNGNVSLDGRAEVMQFEGLSFDSGTQKDIQIYVDDPSALTVDTLPPTDLSFTGVQGSFDFTGASIALDGGPAELQSFTGTFTKHFGDGSHSLDGKVYRAVLGEGNTKTDIGGEGG